MNVFLGPANTAVVHKEKLAKRPAGKKRRTRSASKKSAKRSAGVYGQGGDTRYENDREDDASEQEHLNDPDGEHLQDSDATNKEQRFDNTSAECFPRHHVIVKCGSFVE